MHFNYKEEKSNFQWRNLADTLLIKSSKLMSPVMGHTEIMHSLIGYRRKTQHHLCVGFPPKMHHLNLSMRTHQTNPNWGSSYKITDLSFSKTSRSWKSRLRNCSRLKETKKIQQPRAITRSWTGSFPVKDITETTGKIWTGSEEVSILTSWFWWL